jgi:phosphate starvation-inducible protein PhoH
MNPISFDMSETITPPNTENEESIIVEFKECSNNNDICDTTLFSVELPPSCKKKGKKTKKQNEKEIMKNYFNEIAMKSSEITKETINEEYILDECNTYYLDTNIRDKKSDNSDSRTNSPTNSPTSDTTNSHIGNNSTGITTTQKGSKRSSSTNTSKTTTGKKRGGAESTKHENTGGKGIPHSLEKKIMKPKNASQEQYVNYLNLHNKKIIFAIGPAGTGKTMFATQYAIKHFLLGNYDKIIFTRPTVSVDEDIGFLPGSIEEKLSPWLRPIFDILYEFITVKEVQTFLEEKVFEMAPIGYLRGRTFKRAFIIADEMQNCTKNQMKMLLTRLGEHSRMVVTGDLEQHDRTGETNGLADFLSKLRKRRSESIELVEFERNDILREPIIKEVLEIYSL